MASSDTLALIRVDELRAALLVGLQCGNYSPLEFAPEPSVGLQLRELFINAAAPVKEKLKGAVARAVAEWRPRAHRPDVLVELGYWALDIGACDAIPVLAGWVRREEHAKEPQQHVLQLVAVIAGFAPTIEARDALERLRVTQLGENAGSLILNGLCKCDPSSFPAYLSWFLELPGARNGRFHLGCVLSEMVRNVGLPLINARMGELAPESFELFLKVAQEEVIPALSFITTGRRGLILCERDRVFEASVENDASLGPGRTLPPPNALIAAAAHGRQIATTGISRHLKGLAAICDERSASV